MVHQHAPGTPQIQLPRYFTWWLGLAHSVICPHPCATWHALPWAELTALHESIHRHLFMLFGTITETSQAANAVGRATHSEVERSTQELESVAR